MFGFPLGMVTIWHPEKFFGIHRRDLQSLPFIRKNRDEQELQKSKIAQLKGLEMTIEAIHEGPIINLGKPRYDYRETWLKGIDLYGVISDYSVRLIYTENDRTQAPFRLEARPNWGDAPNTLPSYLISNMRKCLSLSQTRVSVRQIWKNPFTIDTDKTPKGPFYNLGSVVNLVIGPYTEECVRKADLLLQKHPNLISIHQHILFYRDFLSEKDILMLPECKLWWIKYK